MQIIPAGLWDRSRNLSQARFSDLEITAAPTMLPNTIIQAVCCRCTASWWNTWKSAPVNQYYELMLQRQSLAGVGLETKGIPKCRGHKNVYCIWEARCFSYWHIKGLGRGRENGLNRLFRQPVPCFPIQPDGRCQYSSRFSYNWKI